MSTMEEAETYMFKTYARYPICLVRGKGVKVWDEEGKEYLDFIGGIAVCALGHSDERIAEILREQALKLIHVSNLFYTIPQVDLARMLVKYSGMDRVFFCNSGAEANEAAIKLARKYSYERYGKDRYTIICMENSFHGRTLATLSATGQEKVKKGFDPLLSGFKFVPFNDAAALEKAIDNNVCAVLLEPIQGEGGVILPEEGYMAEVEDLCAKYGLLMILDEVQVGMGRTGMLFAHQHYNITPHIITLAKALANGLPMGAMLAKGEVCDAFGPGSHATTFGGSPLVSKIAIEVLERLIQGGVLDNVRRMGKYLGAKLKDLMNRFDIVKDVRGLGLIWGVEFKRGAKEIMEICRDKGLLINCTQDKVLRFLPPLIIGEGEVDKGVEILVSSIEEFLGAQS